MHLWVPPGHRKNWRKHCRDYGACGVSVYFVQDRWYDDHVRHGEPRHSDDHCKGRSKDKGKGKDKGKDGD